jgi:poly(glycerol-phosphate) alpha-glucosyltransferase
MLDKWALRNSAWKKRIARVAFEDANLRAASCIQALNDSEVRAIRSLGLRNPIALIPNGIDVPDSSVTADRPTYLPNDGRRTLLFVGRIHPKKGLKELVQAWAAVHAAAPAVAEGWRLVIAGWDDGDHLHDLLHLTTSLKLEDKIVFPGPLYGREKHAALIHADAFILPSLSEGLPMSVLEAWSYGAPVFMTDECNLGEAFEEGAAIRIENDPVLLARALAKGLASEPPILRQIGDKGRLLVTRRYTREAVTAQYLELYDWLLGRTRHPPKFVQFTP